jgi:3D (Asp-Asp-Asp) domain-containing protein
MLLSRSFRRKLLATALTAAGFVLMYEATVIDSRSAKSPALPASSAPAPLKAGSRLDFVATAYCTGLTTKSGVRVQSGIAAGDPELLPVGSVVQVDGLQERYRGIYTVMDTGGKILGKRIDLYMWSCSEAINFGRRDVVLTVLRLGWSPMNSAPSLK